MTVYGLTDAGLVIKTLSVIIEEKGQEIRALFGDSANIDPESIFGQLINISAEREATLWELLEQVYLAQYPSTASKGALDQVISINGMKRDGVGYSTITDQAFWGTPGTVITAGTVLIVNGDPLSKYTLDSEITLGAGVNQSQVIVFDLNPNTGVWQVSFDGTISPTVLTATATATDVKNALELLPTIDGVTVTGSMLAGFTIVFDGTNVEYRKNPKLEVVNEVLYYGAYEVTPTVVIVSPGVYQGLGSMTATISGTVPKAPAETLTLFENTVAGVSRTLNVSDATRGANVETDAAVKIRREKSLAAFGGGTEAAIRSKVLDIDEVSSCRVYENDTLVTDAYGRPGKSFETFVLQKAEIGGGSPSADIDQLVANVIYQNKSLGIQTYGTLTYLVVDTGGFTRTVKFSRPTSVPIYLIWELSVNAGVFPVDGATLIGNDVVVYGNNLGQGQDVIIVPYLVDVLTNYSGILSVVTKIGTAPSPTLSNNIVIDDGSAGNIELSTWSKANVLFVINGTTYTYNSITGNWEA